MNYPLFFNAIPSIKLQDPLSAFLGSLENGEVEFNYLDVVKSAGHSCPTVMGAYLTTLKGLEALYPNEMPVRGNISVEIQDDVANGVTGVIANVITQITGATSISGFKGINGNFARNNLMEFNANINSAVKFTRVDTKQSVEVNYDPSSVGGSPKQQELMGKIMQGKATPEDKKEFGELWQDRVRRISESIDDVISSV
jgi:formylmethanofuran dehydrogenase subunit E